MILKHELFKLVFRYFKTKAKPLYLTAFLDSKRFHE